MGREDGGRLSANLLNPILAFAAVLFAALAFALVIEGVNELRRRRSVRRRLSPMSGPSAQAQTVQGSDVLMDRRGEATALDMVLGRLPHFRDVALLLEQADMKWGVSSYVAFALGVGGAAGLAINLATGSALLTAVAALAGLVGPYLYLRLRRRRRLDAFEASFPEAIDLMTRAIRAGHPLSSGLQMVAQDGPTAVSGEFQRVFEEHRFGLPFSDALLGMADRIELADVRIFVTAILVQRETGGNLAEILEKIATTLRARFTLRRQLRVYTAQGRLTGMVLSALPIILAMAIYAIDQDYMTVLLEETIGHLMIGGALILQIIGLFWIRNIINIDM